MTFEKIKRFLDEKIFHRRSQKLLMPGEDEEYKNETSIDLSGIYSYLDNEKYTKAYKVFFIDIGQKNRRKLMKKLELMEKGAIINSHDSYPITEGKIADEYFISVRRKNVKINRIGQTLVTDNFYIDITTRKNYNENYYADLVYKEIKRKHGTEDMFVFDSENEAYYRKIKNNDIVFIESASYDNEEKIFEIEKFAQPTTNTEEVNEYLKITKLSYISNEAKSRVKEILKSNPYISNIQAIRLNKNNESISKKELIKIYKSKKECIVGYKPEIILYKDSDNNEENIMVYRLLSDGLYVDNSTFKSNFEGKYTIKKVKFDEIKQRVEIIPFSISEESKKILRNGLEIKNYIKTIYEKGINKL